MKGQERFYKVQWFSEEFCESFLGYQKAFVSDATGGAARLAGRYFAASDTVYQGFERASGSASQMRLQLEGVVFPRPRQCGDTTAFLRSMQRDLVRDRAR